jgi:hypothetical protein
MEGISIRGRMGRARRIKTASRIGKFKRARVASSGIE